MYRLNGKRHRCAAALLIAVCAIASTEARVSTREDLQALIVGGGPSPESNQVAIESNVRYVLRLLPPGTPRTVLFADGDKRARTVVYDDGRRRPSTEEHLLNLILESGDSTTRLRAPNIAQLDGAAKRADVAQAFDRIGTDTASADRPLLLYFTGHGSRNEHRDLTNNIFDLWGERLCVRDLAAHLARIPANRPVTLVMVQCFSGAFGNLLFQGGDPANRLTDRDFAGFFATIESRMAAGCTPEVDEREYRDFSSYFFAALSGQDRLGRRVTGADYNGDGRVGMDEAYCYAVGHDVSIDVPVCTSDVFLRRFARMPDAEVFKTRYGQVISWASPAQKAALEELSRSLQFEGDDRGSRAYAQFLEQGDSDGSGGGRVLTARRRFRRQVEEAQRTLYSRWPDLRDARSSNYKSARAEALAAMKRSDEFKFPSLVKAEEEMDSAYEEAYKRELVDARLIRFVRMFKSVTLAHAIREGSDESLKRSLSHLSECEARSLLNAPKAVAQAP